MSRVLKRSSGIDCPARTIREEELQAAVVTAINDAWSQKDSILPVLQENIREVLESDTQERVAAVDTAIREKQAEALTKYSETLVRRLIEKITIYDKKLTVEFKSGLEIDVEA